MKSAILAVGLALISGCAEAGGGTSSADPTETIISDLPPASLEALMQAAIEADDLAQVEAILEAGLDPADYPDNEVTPLHRAAAGNYPDIVRVLVAAGADLEARTGRRTPLMLAAASDAGEASAALIELGADVEAQDPGFFGATPMHFAAQFGGLASLEAMIGEGVPVDIVDADGSTPLLYAAIFGQADAAEYLLDCGADVNARDGGGDTPLRVTDRNAYPELAQLLEDVGGVV